jgi:hypothetical protein
MRGVAPPIHTIHGSLDAPLGLSVPELREEESDERPASLQRALEEVALVEQELLSNGDRHMLARYGDSEAGAALAASLGYSLLTTSEARTVDRLRWLPDGGRLVRLYLLEVGLRRSTAVQIRHSTENRSAPANSDPSPLLASGT